MSLGTQIQPESWRIRVHDLVGAFLNFLFPPVCAYCKKVGTLLCAECRADIVWITEPICEICGQPLAKTQDTCGLCARRTLPLQQVRTAVLFQEPVQTLIHQFKYENTFALGQILADIMGQAWPHWQQPIERIIPIPLHKERYRQRGYNQSELLARWLARQLQIPLDTNVLQRIRYTQPQVQLSTKERHLNVADAFAVSDNGHIQGQHLLLIDDVFTTGATLSAATRVLLEAGAGAVSGYCLARAK